MDTFEKIDVFSAAASMEMDDSWMDDLDLDEEEEVNEPMTLLELTLATTEGNDGHVDDWKMEVNVIDKQNTVKPIDTIDDALKNRDLLTDTARDFAPEACEALAMSLDVLETKPTETSFKSFNECLRAFQASMEIIHRHPETEEKPFDIILKLIKRNMRTTTMLLDQDHVDSIIRQPRSRYAFVSGALAHADALCEGRDFHAETTPAPIEGQIWAFIQGRTGETDCSVSISDDKIHSKKYAISIPGEPILSVDTPKDLKIASVEIVRKIGSTSKRGSDLDKACRDAIKALTFKAGGKKAKTKAKTRGISVDEARIATSLNGVTRTIIKLNNYLETTETESGFLNAMSDFPHYLQERTVEQTAIAFRIFGNFFASLTYGIINKIAHDSHSSSIMVKKLDEARFRFAVAYLRFTDEVKRVDTIYTEAFKTALLKWKQDKSDDRRHRPFDAPPALVAGFTESLVHDCDKFIADIGLDEPNQFLNQCLEYPKVSLEPPIAPLIAKSHKMHDVQVETLRLFLEFKGRLHIDLRAGTGSGKTTLIALIAYSLLKMRGSPGWEMSPEQMVVYAPNPSILAMIMGTLYNANVSFGVATFMSKRKGIIDRVGTAKRKQQWDQYVKATNQITENKWSRRIKSIHSAKFHGYNIKTGLNADGMSAWEVRCGASEEGVEVIIPSDRQGTNTWGGETFEECFNGKNRVTVMIATTAKTLATIMGQTKDPNRICLVLDDAVAVACTDKGEDSGDITGLGVALRYCPESVIHMSATLPRKINAFKEVYAKRHPTCSSRLILGDSVPTGTCLLGKDGKQYVPHGRCETPVDLIECANRVNTDPILARFPTAEVVTSLLSAWRFTSTIPVDFNLENCLRIEMTKCPVYQTFWKNQYVSLLRAISDTDVDIPAVVNYSLVKGDALPTTGEGNEMDYDISEIIASGICKGGCFIGTATPKQIAMRDIPLAFAKLLGIKMEADDAIEKDFCIRIISSLLDDYLTFETRLEEWNTKREAFINEELRRKETMGSKASRRSGLSRDGKMGDRKAGMISRYRAEVAEAFDRDSKKPNRPADPVPPILNDGNFLPPDPATDETFDIMSFPSINTWFKYLLGCCRIAIVYDEMPKEYEALIYRYIEAGHIRYVISDWRTAYGLDVPCSVTIRLKSFKIYGSATDFQLAGRSGRLGKESQGTGRAYMIDADDITGLLESTDPYAREGEILSRGVDEISPLVEAIAKEDAIAAEIAELRLHEREKREECERVLAEARKAALIAEEEARLAKLTKVSRRPRSQRTRAELSTNWRNGQSNASSSSSSSSSQHRQDERVYVPPHLRRNGSTRPRPLPTGRDWSSLRG